MIGGIGGGLLVRRQRRRGQDQQYLGLTPGLMPAAGQEDAVGPRRKGPVAVQFTPPAGLRAGQLGTLLDERADTRDVTATIVDLAVRGYLLIQQLAPDGGRGPADWRLVRTAKAADDLLPYERSLIDALFSGRDQVELSELRTTFASSMAEVQTQLYAEVTERGWFARNPRSARYAAVGRGVLVLLGGIALTAVLAVFTSFALVGLVVVVLGVVLLAMSGSAPARTAAGTAVLDQAQGFRLYLATAEAAQLRFEEGEDLFSRYLPFAVAFGLTERWAQLFEQLAAQGRQLETPSWYLGYGAVGFWHGGSGFAADLDRFTHIADSAISAPTPGSSGSSGSGGFSGGGVGGGGGGSW